MTSCVYTHIYIILLSIYRNTKIYCNIDNKEIQFLNQATSNSSRKLNAFKVERNIHRTDSKYLVLLLQLMNVLFFFA